MKEAVLKAVDQTGHLGAVPAIPGAAKDSAAGDVTQLLDNVQLPSARALAGVAAYLEARAGHNLDAASAVDHERRADHR